MKNLRLILAMALAVTAIAISSTARADETSVKPYPLNTCLVCGMTFDSTSKPYVFVYKGQEIKLCDESEKAVFDKDPDKYLKKLADAAAKSKK